jgi:tetratricopeptide (TPR) repeat protein
LTEAARFFEQAAALRPDDYQAVSYLAMTNEAMGRKDEARAASRRALPILEQHIQLDPNDARACYTGTTELSRLGEREKAFQWVSSALALDPEDGAVLYGIADAACWAGD